MRGSNSERSTLSFGLLSRHLFTHWGPDEDHISHGCERTCPTESELQDMDLDEYNRESAFAKVYSHYMDAREALLEARSARGFFPVVIPEAVITHLKKSFPSTVNGKTSQLERIQAKANLGK